MKTYKFKTAEIAKRLVASESSLYNCIKRFNLYLSPRGKEFLGKELAHDFKEWAKERNINYKNVTIADALKGWGKYELGKSWNDAQNGQTEKPVLIAKVPRYKLTEDKQDFIYQEIIDKRGHSKYSKVIEFYTFEPKTKWTLSEVATCVARAYDDEQAEVVYKTKTAYELIDGKLYESDDEELQYRAQITAAEEAALIVANNEE